MNYHGVIRKWMREETKRGLSPKDAYRLILDEVDRELRSILVEMVPLDEELLETLRAYVIERGFYFNGHYYFRVSWLDSKVREELEDRGIIKKIGRSTELRRRGVEIPPFRHEGSSIFYAVDEEIIDKIA